MTSLLPSAPMVGDLLSWPVDRRIRRSFYTDKLDMSDKITEDKSVMPDIAAKAKPRLGDNSLIEVLQKILQKQNSEKVEESMPSNLDYRK